MTFNVFVAFVVCVPCDRSRYEEKEQCKDTYSNTAVRVLVHIINNIILLYMFIYLYIYIT